LGDGGADGSLALQNLVEKAALDAVTPGKSVLASFPLNSCLEQPDNVIVFKHKWGAAHFACAPGTSRFRLFTFCQCKRPGEISRNPGDTVQCGKTSLRRGVLGVRRTWHTGSGQVGIRYCPLCANTGHSKKTRKRIVTPEAAEIAALLEFGPVRTWSSHTTLELCCGDDQRPLRYSGQVQNRRRFPRAGDTNGRWDSLRIVEKAVSSNRTIDCDRTVQPDQRRRAAASSRVKRKTAVPVRRL